MYLVISMAAIPMAQKEELPLQIEIAVAAKRCSAMWLLALYTMSNPMLISRITGMRIMRLYPSYIFALSAI